MTEKAPSIEDVKTQLAKEIRQVHCDSYGEDVENVEVAIEDTFIALVMDVKLTQAERTLMKAGDADSVKRTREAFQEAIAPTFAALAERASGRRVTSFASRTIVDGRGSWSAELFRLGDRRNGD
jgi:uncharacterized protein YbcI